MDEDELSARLELAIACAREAGAITLEYFCQRNYAVELKADSSPVTVADRRSEQHIRARVAKRFASDAILGEEFPESPGSSGFRWILDPIDGTKSFISGVPLYGTLIGVEYQSRSIVGVIQIPALGELAYGARGRGAWYVRSGEPPIRATVSPRSKLSESLFLTSDVAGYAVQGRRDAFDRLLSACRLSRTWGDCYGYLLVATGRAEVMLDPQMNVWDCAALQPILEEAGGTFTDWQGVPTIRAGEALATNGHVLDKVLAVTRDYPLRKSSG